MTATTDIVAYGQAPAYAPAIQEQALTAENLKRQVSIVREAQRAVMKKGHHFDTIPGCGTKPVLLKPGAEVIAMTFQFAPAYNVEKDDLGGGHREYSVTCVLTHRPTGGYVGQGVGSCSTRETKWLYRNSERVCPKCGEPTIFKSKPENGDGWYCWAKKGGCGAKFAKEDASIAGQVVGRVEHDNPADYYNTCLKMAKKRAFVDAILTSTSASDVFTQDIDDAPESFGGKPEPRRLNMESVRATFSGCLTMDQLDSALSDLGIDKKHPDAKAVSEAYREFKSLIENANADNQF